MLRESDVAKKHSKVAISSGNMEGGGQEKTGSRVSGPGSTNLQDASHWKERPSGGEAEVTGERKQHGESGLLWSPGEWIPKHRRKGLDEGRDTSPTETGGHPRRSVQKEEEP